MTILRGFVPACVVAVAACGTAAGDPSASAEDALLPTLAGTSTVYRDARITMVSDETIDVAVRAKIAKEIEDGYAFDTTYQGWSATVLQSRFQVAVVSTALMKKATGQAGGGICWDKDSFFTDTVITSTRPIDIAFEANTVAHELQHMQMERLNAFEPAVPIYAFEGIACVLGDWYVALKAVTGAEELLRSDVKGLAGMTEVDAHDLFDNFSTSYGEPGKIYWRELMGAMFLEYVRAHVCKDPDKVLLDWGRLTLQVGGGASFEQAFLDSYGTSLSDAQASFVAFMSATKGDAHARFKGTVWEGYE